jgi:hypothetical protein
MKRLGFWFALITTVVVPLVRTLLARRQKRSRLRSLAASAGGAGESALDALSGLAGTALEQLGVFGEGSRRRAGSTTPLAATTASLLAGAPRLVAQLRGDDGYPYRGREDWRKYGDVFGR